MTAVLIFNYLKNRINRLYALLGAVLFLSTPIIVKLSITVYVDLGLVFFSTLSILHIINALNKEIGKFVRYRYTNANRIAVKNIIFLLIFT